MFWLLAPRTSCISGFWDCTGSTSFPPLFTATPRCCNVQISFRVEDLLGRVPLIPCFLDGNATSTIPHKYSSRQKDTFDCGCADGAGTTSRKGSHVYEINTRLWNVGRPQPRVGDLSVAKTEKLRRKSRSEASKRGWATKQARKWPSHGICIVYTWYMINRVLGIQYLDP
jgi:hypothetical protein